MTVFSTTVSRFKDQGGMVLGLRTTLKLLGKEVYWDDPISHFRLGVLILLIERHK
jgi:hypothetical protein